jgi:hypothetical protein
VGENSLLKCTLQELENNIISEGKAYSLNSQHFDQYMEYVAIMCLLKTRVQLAFSTLSEPLLKFFDERINRATVLVSYKAMKPQV